MDWNAGKKALIIILGTGEGLRTHTDIECWDRFEMLAARNTKPQTTYPVSGTANEPHRFSYA